MGAPGKKTNNKSEQLNKDKIYEIEGLCSEQASLSLSVTAYNCDILR